MKLRWRTIHFRRENTADDIVLRGTAETLADQVYVKNLEVLGHKLNQHYHVECKKALGGCGWVSYE